MRNRPIRHRREHFIRRWLRLSTLPAFLALIAIPGARAADAPLGATVDGLLAEAERLSPAIAARGHEADAAIAGARVAGSFPDPTLRFIQDEIDTTSLPRRPKEIYMIEQEIPLWGKNGLQAAVGRARADIARADGRSAAADLAERVKVTFAQYWMAHQAAATTREVRGIDQGVLDTARVRYIQDQGAQADVLRASAAVTRRETVIAAFRAQKQAAQGVLNALLLRDAKAPLADPLRLRPLPPETALEPAALTARANNPVVAAAKSEIAVADSNRELARREWYPNVQLSVGAIERNGYGPNGWLGSVGIRVPLEVGLHRAQEMQAMAELRAANSRREAATQELARGIAEAAATLAGARETERLTRDQLLPQLDAAVRSAVAAYRNGLTDLTPVLDAVRDLQEARLSLLTIQYDEQRQLAAIERLIGGPL